MAAPRTTTTPSTTAAPPAPTVFVMAAGATLPPRPADFLCGAASSWQTFVGSQPVI